MPQSISAEPLARIVQSITFQKRTGVLRIEQLGGRGAERGEIYFENGSLLRARTEHETGKAALQRIGEWKQITCSFQGVSRPPYSATVPLTQPELKAETPQTRVSSQTDPLAPTPSSTLAPTPSSTPALNAREARANRASEPLLAGEKTTRELNSRQVEVALSMRAQSAQANQPLVLHGTTLEAYTPVQAASPSRSVQRWTTHQASELETLPMPRKPPPTPRLSPMPGAEALPGRMAIFKASRTVPVAQAIQQMERHSRLVFILLDGQRTIQDIARLIHQTESDVEQILLNLTQRGFTHYERVKEASK